MLRKILFTMLALVMLLGTMSASSITNPSFPPMHIYADIESCYFPWVDDDFNPVTLTGAGRGHWTGNRYLHQCSTTLDFNDPGIASLEQVCSVVPEFCNGNKSFRMTEKDGVICYASGFFESPGTIKVLNNGRVDISCRLACCQLP